MGDAVYLSMVIPAHNERGAIGEVIDSVRAALDRTGCPYEIVVVDDGSTDGTAGIASEMGVEVLRFPKNRGVGVARSMGVRKARGEIIVMIDADMTYPAESIPELVSATERYDMVIGARKKEAGSVALLRRPAKAFIQAIASYLVREKILDLNSGMRAFRREAALQYLPILPRGHSWVSTITIAFSNDGYLVGYVPIDYRKRRGKSTFHPVKDTLNYLALVIRTVTYFNPLRVFLPVSILVFLLGIVSGTLNLLVSRTLQQIDIILIIFALLLGMMGLLADVIVASRRRGP